MPNDQKLSSSQEKRACVEAHLKTYRNGITTDMEFTVRNLYELIAENHTDPIIFGITEIEWKKIEEEYARIIRKFDCVR